MRRIALVALKLTVSLGLLFLLYRQAPIDQIRDLLSTIQVGYLPAIALMLLFNTVLSAWKWQLFLRADGISIGLGDLFVSYMSGTFCNLFLPSNIGGDSYRIYDIAQRSRDGARSAASVFADRFSGFIALVVLSVLSSIYVSLQFRSLNFMLVPLALLAAFVGVLVIIRRPAPFRWLLAVSGLNRFAFIERTIEKLLLSFSCYGANKVLLVKVMAISFAFQMSLISVVYLMACALGVQLAFFYFSAFVPLINLMEALPISIYGVGIRDYGYVLFFSQVGMSGIETRTLALLFVVVAVCYSLLGGLFFLYRIWWQPRRVRDDKGKRH
jgi:glycosyltransferase 2 family protein